MKIETHGIRAAFFDIDGTLSVPRYMRGGKLMPGGSKEWWKSFCYTSPFAYQNCGIPVAIKWLLNALQRAGSCIFVLSEETVPEAEPQKRLFIRKRYKKWIPDGNIIFVPDKKMKPRLIAETARRTGCRPEEFLFMDDSFDLVIEASMLGISAHHISELLAYE